jgi:Kef-type K+ transport system membrane component KefB/mannitol/fructose-specific phosphotransferase system IIA component (Ntr-type)
MQIDLLNLLLVLLAGWLAGWGATRLGYPSVLGELLVGILLGPPLLGLLHGSEALSVLAEIGILLMMLYVGMEVDPRDLGRASRAGLLAAAGGFVTPFALAYLAMGAFGASPMAATFVGIAAGVTSLTTKSRILVDLRLLDTRVAHVMMAGALVSDTLSLVLFAGVLGVVDSGALDLAGVARVAGKVLLFFAGTFLAGVKLFPWLGRRLTAAGLTSRTFHFTFVLLLAVAFGELAHLAGLHAILGAFLAGLFLRDEVLGRKLSHELIGAVREASIGFLAPIFFVTAGFQVSMEVFRADLPLLLTVVAVAIAGKVAGTALFYVFSGNGWREGLVIGGGMNGRGAVEIIVAGIGLEMGLISREVFSILVFMAIFTTATVPVLLKWGTDWLRRRGELVRSTGNRDGTLILGAGPLARRLAREMDGRRRLIDANPARCRSAAQEGLSVVCGNALQEPLLAEAGAADAATLVALTPNAEINALVAQLARGSFGVPEIVLVHDGAHGTAHRTSAAHLGSTTLFGRPFGLADWDHWLDHGATREEWLAVQEGASALDWLRGRPLDARHLPVLLARGPQRSPFHDGLRLLPGDRVLVLEHVPAAQPEGDWFDDLVRRAPILDLRDRVGLEQLFARVADELGGRLGTSAATVFERLWERERAGSTVLSPGLAIPHFPLEEGQSPSLVVVRARPGVVFPEASGPVPAVFVLATSPTDRTLHLRGLSAITQVANAPGFDDAWRAAADSHALRSLLLSAERRRF